MKEGQGRDGCQQMIEGRHREPLLQSYKDTSNGQSAAELCSDSATLHKSIISEPDTTG